MINRRNRALLALLVVQLLLLAALTISNGAVEQRQIQPLLAPMTAASIDRLSIAETADEALQFARGVEGWVLPEADDFPLNSAKIDDMLARLLALDTRRLIASNPANFPRLEVADDDFRRRLVLQSGDASMTVYLGGSGGADTVYARRDGDNAVYLGTGLNAWELSLQLSSWLDANVVNVPVDDLLEIRVDNAQGQFTFLREGDGWLYTGLGDGELFDDTGMSNLARNAAALPMQAPLGLAVQPDYGLAQPSVTVTVRYQEPLPPAADADEPPDTDTAAADDMRENSYSLRFGATLASGDVVLQASNFDYIVAVRESLLSSFKDMNHADLLQAPSENEAEERAPGAVPALATPSRP